MSQEREYLLGTDREELVRLGFQHQVWSAETASLWESAGFGPGHALLDVGCGPGYATFDLADRVGPRGRVIGVDLSARFVAHLTRQAEARGEGNVEARVGRVEELDLPAESLDGAWARWVFTFISDPDAVVRGVARALRPGGTFAVMDYCRYEGSTVAPRAEETDRVIRATSASISRAGGNPDVGSVLPQVLHRAGLEITEVRPIVRVARPGSALWRWPETFFASYLGTLVELSLITEEDAEAFRRRWSSLSSRPDAFLLTPPMVGIVAAKP